MTTPARRLSLLAAAATALLAACGAPADDTAADPSSSTPASEASTSGAPTSGAPSETPVEPAGPQLAITVEGDDVSPNAEEISLEVDQPLAVTIRSDRAGELHVHSKPEQYVDFEAGDTSQELVITTPGVVEIEDHDTGAVVAVVEVQ